MSMSGGLSSQPAAVSPPVEIAAPVAQPVIQSEEEPAVPIKPVPKEDSLDDLFGLGKP
ncbi:hypothetical protein [Chitinimonas arctica]|uniref:hypothetical protein n=1 Tax=Chitinimonas arctica TaxID=2594795 RepID=UPI0015D1ED27|nr:hypothetical protein [Chitinimonas arctica]